MATPPAPGSSRTRVGAWAVQAVRVAAALVLLAGLAGAAGSAARREPLVAFRSDLDAGRVTEVVFAGPGSYRPPGALTGADPRRRTVRWEVAGGGRRTADLSEGVGSRYPGEGSGEVGSTDGADLSDLTPSTEAEVERDLRARVAAAGVPVRGPGGQPAEAAVRASGLAALVLVVFLLVGPQPRRATKWAWFWLMLVPGGLAQLAWLAAEAPWSRRVAAGPEPRPHRQEPADTRLTGGRAVLLAIALTVLVGMAGWQLTNWLAG
jgi:hypothetical protein